AVAGAAVRLGDGADEANPSPGGREAMVARLVRRVAGRQGLERPERGLDPGAALRARDESPACDRLRVPGAEGHGLDETDVPGPVEGERGERYHVVLVEPADDDGVQLDWSQACRLGRLDAGPDVGQRAPAHHAR